MQQVPTSVKIIRCVKVDINLNLNNHKSDLCKKANRKISTLARVAPNLKFTSK